MKTTFLSAPFAFLACALAVTGCGAGSAPSLRPEALGSATRANSTKHVNDAFVLVRVLADQYLKGTDLNDYTSNNSKIVWKGENGATQSENYTVCGSFVTTVILHAFGKDTTFWKNNMGSTSPFAEDYHAKIKAGVPGVFSRFTSTNDMVAGDVIAIKYNQSTAYPENSKSTGHVMIVSTLPSYSDVPTAQDATNLLDYADIYVYDSTSSPHGTVDTRRPLNLPEDKGAGRGIFRLIVRKSDRVIVGYRWSPIDGTAYWQTPTSSTDPNAVEASNAEDLVSRHLVVGHLLLQ